MNKRLPGQESFNGPYLLRLLAKQKAGVAIVAMLVLMVFSDTNFYTAFNLLDILNSASINMILAAGVTVVIVCGGCDLSIGGLLSMAGIICIKLMEIMPILPAILITVGIGALVGFVNGFFVVHQRTEPFVITLGMGMVLKGVAQELTEARPIAPTNPDFMYIANSKMIGTLPNLVLYMIIVLVIFYLVLRFTTFGRNCYATGGSYDVAVYSGINAVRTKWAAFVLSGITASLGGVLLSSKLNSGSSIYGDATALLVNCGAVVGGTSFAGGRGGIPHTFLGLFVLVLLQNVMNMLAVNAYVQQVFQGCVIVAIIWFDSFGIKLKRESV